MAPDLAASGAWEDWLLEGEAHLEKLALAADRVLGKGRGASRSVVFTNGAAGVWRVNRHGGMLGNLQGDRYPSPERLQLEVELSEGLRAEQVRTPRVLLALAVKDGKKWRQHLVTEEVAGAETVFAARKKPAALVAAGQLMDQVFELGLWATDLHPDNLLWREQDQSCWLIDLAGAKRLSQPLDASQRAARIDRFFRYYRKHAGEEPEGAARLRSALR
ncbi:MAG: hypothetical protein O3A95_04950 [Planctomycetota bacterium]|nr:hypothetical protein [Planctomycetota bacterium]MDA1113632.1 hypothetical protein [Planctomycetota bacterium]